VPHFIRYWMKGRARDQMTFSEVYTIYRQLALHHKTADASCIYSYYQVC